MPINITNSSGETKGLNLPAVVSSSTLQDKFDVIITIVVPILLVISSILAIYYMNNPVTPIFKVAENFSLSLPVIICNIAGGVLGLALLVQIFRYKQVYGAFERTFGRISRQEEIVTQDDREIQRREELRRIENMEDQIQKECSLKTEPSGLMDFVCRKTRLFTHMGKRADGESASQYEKAHPEESKIMEIQSRGERVSFQTCDGITLNGYWQGREGDRPTVIMLQPNGGVCFNPITDFYRVLGFNTLVLEYRGYGLSGGEAGGPNQEREAYLDAAAALKFVISKGVSLKNVIAHGYSLGGAYAAALGSLFNVQHIVLDHTFTSLADLCENKVSFLPWKKLMNAAYVQSEKESVADGFDSLAKVQKMTGEIFVISGENDTLTPPKFGQALAKARYGDSDRAKRNHVIITGGHNDGDFFFYDREAKAQYLSFLHSRNLLLSANC